MLQVEHTTRSYAGKPGCMCGCNGNYNESTRARKLALTHLLNHPDLRFQRWNDDKEGCLYLVKATRNRVVYLTPEGVSTAKLLNIPEEK